MALQKTPITVNFLKGLNTKADPKQLSIDHFTELEDSVFDVEGQLTKRNGFAIKTRLPNQDQTTLTTLNDNLLATGSDLYAYSAETNQWVNQGAVQPVAIETVAVVRSATSQTSPDVAISDSGLACTTFLANNTGYYQISDLRTGQQIVPRVELLDARDVRAFAFGRYFIVVFIGLVGGNPHLQYIAVPISNPSNPRPPVDISTQTTITSGFDCVAVNDSLFISYSTATTVETTYLSAGLLLAAPKSITSSAATRVSMIADQSQATPVVWVVFYDLGTQAGYVAAYDQVLNVVLAKTAIITGVEVANLTGVAEDGALELIYEVINTYSFTPNAQTDYLERLRVTQGGTVGTPVGVLRSVGLASKAFVNDTTGMPYVLATYGEQNQPTYFLIDFGGNIYARLAASNGGGYETRQTLSSVNLFEGSHVLAYLYKSFLAPVNKGTDLAAGTPQNAIYTQTGVNLAKLSINTSGQYSSEIASSLHLTGGMLWQYDGVKPVEHGFQVFPENAVVTTAGTGGSIAAGKYYYQFTYEWTDNKGNLHRSAPSIPVEITTTGSTSKNTINVPTLRLTYKTTPNPVRIVGYRWSANQQTYYQFTSLTSPKINDPTVDSVTIEDDLADSSILGQTLLYTTGGIVENIAAPASIDSTLYKNRLWLISAENPNTLHYSKEVVQNTPVEMSDLFTVYVAPSAGSQGSTGPCKAISAMDDKLIIFKPNAIYYLTGRGPDAAGANNDFIDPTFITAAVGTSNPNSIVLTPHGLMFESDKGIWLLDRGLGTKYVGAPVQKYNGDRVRSAEAIPGTNQVRFNLTSGITLVYDYFYDQWGTFTGLRVLSGTIYEGKHTYLTSFGEIFQETSDKYLDGSRPVLVKFTTAWTKVAGIQGFQRLYEILLLGTYYSPFKLNVSIAFDYGNPSQQVVVTPDNYSPTWGGESVWGGGGSWGGPGNVFEARVFPEQQKCESFQITVEEVYDPSHGQTAGEGLSLSGLTLVVGAKKGYRTTPSGRSFG